MNAIIAEGTRRVEGLSNAIQMLAQYATLCPENAEEVLVMQCAMLRQSCRISQNIRDLVLVDWMNR
jgi:hypothetical protein